MQKDKYSYFSTFVETCEKIKITSSKIKKVDHISAYLSHLDEQSLYIAVLFLTGKVFERGSNLNLNVGYKTIIQSLLEISNLNYDDIKRINMEHGDVGAIAEYAVSNKKMITLFDTIYGDEEKLRLDSIYTQFKKISIISGPQSNTDKKNLLKGLINRCSPLESKYLIKIITNEMRIGSYDGLVELAIAKAFDKDVKKIRESVLILGNVSKVAILSKNNSLDSITIDPFVPMSFMLADVMITSQKIFEYFERPLLCEYKYDGIRLQMHKFKDKCKIYSRNLSDISFAFPEIVNAGLTIHRIKDDNNSKEDNNNFNKNHDALMNDSVNIDFILDGELIAFKDDKPLHFQELQKRLHKKNMTSEMMKRIPIRYIVFDIMYFDNKQVINETLESRKNLLSKLYFNGIIMKTQSDIVNSSVDIDNRFKNSKDKGHEGLVIKDPASFYHPGKRGKHWIKLKEELDTIDVVVVMAEYGHGKKAGTLSDYTLAVVDTDTNDNENKDTDNLKIIGKAYSGLSDEEVEYMTNKMKSLILRDEGSRILVKPEVILEISFDTVQRSNRHNSGYALRFPRIKNIRYDKSIENIDSLDKVKEIYENQFYVKSKSKKDLPSNPDKK
ncbi:MAG TPA: ATP-dependent DNA ligase [Candidatus Nitrosocosmicus sp.]